MVKIGLTTPAALAALSLLGAAGCATDAVQGDTVVNRRPMPYIETRFGNTVRQVHDFSCGAAAIATILTFYYDDPTTETDGLDALKATYVGDFAKSQDDGFSFSDLIRASEHLGYAAQAVAIEARELAKLDGPVIVHLDKDVLQHFVVLRRVQNGAAYVSDPIVGDTTMPLHVFEEQFTGNALAIWREGVDLPAFSPLLAVGDRVSVSNSLAASLAGVSPRYYPIF